MLARTIKGARREQLLQCAKAVFAQRGYYAASVADIIAAAGVARGTFYGYFDGKRQIFDQILDELLADIDQRIVVIETGPLDPPPLQQLRGNLERVFSLLLEDRHLVEILLHQAAGLDEECRAKLDRFYHSILDQIESALRMGMRMGLVRACEPRVTAAAVLGAVQGMVAEAVQQGPGWEQDRIIDQILAFGLYGVLEPSSHQ
jgi:AcrR family transcriptional regulator